MGAEHSSVASDTDTSDTSEIENFSANDQKETVAHELQKLNIELQREKRKKDRLIYELESQIIGMKRRNSELRHKVDRVQKRKRSLESEVYELQRNLQRGRSDRLKYERILRSVKRNID